MNALDYNKVTSWWWVRHAPVTSHQGRLYGNSDVPANTEDVEAFEGLAAKLPKGALWVASHLQRTHQTANAIVEAGHPAAEPLVEEDLAEQCFGDWQGMTYAEVAADRAGEDHPFWIAPAHYAAPNGESFATVMARVSDTVLRLSVDHAGRDIVAVAHGGTIRAALGQALGIEPDQALSFTVNNLSITRIDCFHSANGDMNWCVIGVNLPPSIGAPHGVVFPPRR
jgi:broad specificity phosphatase PhoE